MGIDLTPTDKVPTDTEAVVVATGRKPVAGKVTDSGVVADKTAAEKLFAREITAWKGCTDEGIVDVEGVDMMHYDVHDMG